MLYPRRPLVATPNLVILAIHLQAQSSMKEKMTVKSRTTLRVGGHCAGLAVAYNAFIDNFGAGSTVTPGESYTGDAVGGRGRNRGPGGNALSGNAGPSNGGRIVNEAGTVSSTDSSMRTSSYG